MDESTPSGLTIDEQIVELKAAHWREMSLHIWRSPSGALFRGPHGAWKHMKADTHDGVTLVRRFRSTAQELGVGFDQHWFVYDRPRGATTWHMHCGPYSTFEQAAEWIRDIREVLV